MARGRSAVLEDRAIAASIREKRQCRPTWSDASITWMLSLLLMHIMINLGGLKRRSLKFSIGELWIGREVASHHSPMGAFWQMDLKHNPESCTSTSKHLYVFGNNVDGNFSGPKPSSSIALLRATRKTMAFARSETRIHNDGRLLPGDAEKEAGPWDSCRKTTV